MRACVAFVGKTFSTLTSTHCTPPPLSARRWVEQGLTYTSTTSSSPCGLTTGSQGIPHQSSSLSRKCSTFTARTARHPWWCTAGGAHQPNTNITGLSLHTQDYLLIMFFSCSVYILTYVIASVRTYVCYVTQITYTFLDTHHVRT